MSVYIDMEMPTSCGECPLADNLCCTLLPGVPAVWAEFTASVREKRRHKDCPLVPVPPHGRWIETTQPMGWDDVTCAECSECGEDFVLDEWGMDDMKNFMHYCPNCGAKMEVG